MLSSKVSFCLLVLVVTEILAHSYVSFPATRGNQGQTQAGCRGPSCLGPCEPRSGTIAPLSVKRGDTITIKWPRNNHPGGFNRFAFAATSATTNAEYDAGAFLYECFEKGPACAPDSASSPNGGGSTDNGCVSTFTVPLWLTDGQWTLQWLWFGGGFTLGDYYSCIDYTVSGGPTGSRSDPVFIGGDYAYPNQPKCKFFNTDEPHKCVNEPCNNPKYTLSEERSGAPTNIAIGAASSTSSGQVLIACSNNTDCPSGVCQLNGYCFNKSKGLDAGGIAAIFFAMLFVVIVVVAVIFAFVNKTEWSNWKPFKK